jgi:uncharacterized protein
MTKSNAGLWLLRFSVNHPKMILWAVAIGLFYASSFIPQVRLKLNANSLIPTGNPDLIQSMKAADLFSMQDMIVIGVVNRHSSIYNPNTLRRIMRLSRAVMDMGGVVPKSTFSLATAPMLSTDGDQIEALPLLSEDQDLNAEAIRRIRNRVEFLGINNGVLVAADGSAAGIFAQVEPQADRYRILAQVRGLVAQEADAEDTVCLSGTALAQAVLGKSAALDIARLIPAVILVLGVALIAAFRHILPALISLAEIGASLILTAGLMGVMKQPVFVTTLVMPVILIAVGVSDDVYVLTHYFDEANAAKDRPRQEIIVTAFAKMFRPVGLTAVSTVIGLLSLAVTAIEPLRIFGIYGAVAICFSTLFTFTLVPALLALLNPQMALKARTQTRRRRAMLRLVYGLNAVRPWRLLLLSLVVAICAALFSTRVSVDDNWIKNLPESSDIAQGDGTLNTRLAGTTTLDLMVDSKAHSGFTDPEKFALLGAAEEAVAALPFVGAVHSVFTDVVRVNAALKNVRYEDLRKALLEGRTNLTQDEIEQAVFLLSSATGIPLIDRLAYGSERAHVTIFVRLANYERIEAVLRAASSAGFDRSNGGIDITPFGDGWISYLTVQILVKGQVYSIAFAMLTDLLLLSILFKSVRAGLVAILPVGFSVLVVFAILAATHTPLGIANSMFAGIAIGIGLDFSIHLTNAYHQGVYQGGRKSASLRRAVVETGPAIITSALAISAGFSILALSEVTPNVQLGLMISFSLLVCAGATLLLVPSLALLRRTTERLSESRKPE